MIFNRKNFLIVKKFFAQKFFSLYRYIIRKIFLKISKFPIALCVNVCYPISVVIRYNHLINVIHKESEKKENA